MTAARAYTLDADQARQGDGGTRIEKTGLYIGAFTEVKAIKNDKGTEGVEMAFESDQGAEARYLTLWTYNAQGQEIYGFKQFNALMACMSVRGITPQQGMGKEYIDGKMKEVAITIYPEMTGPKVGLILQKKLYTKKNGDTGETMDMIGFCNAESRKTASEILDKTDATAVESMLKTLSEVRDDRRDIGGGSGSAPAGNNPPPTGGRPAVDDGIVF